MLEKDFVAAAAADARIILAIVSFALCASLNHFRLFCCQHFLHSTYKTIILFLVHVVVVFFFLCLFSDIENRTYLFILILCSYISITLLLSFEKTTVKLPSSFISNVIYMRTYE